MDNLIEEKICKTFFDKRCSERLFYELSSKKKRSVFLYKMCHDSEKYLGKCIYKTSDRPFDVKEIERFFGREKCYCLSLRKEIDGLYSDLSKILDLLWSNGMPYLMVNAECTMAYLETEYNFNEHKSFFLKLHL